MLIARRFFVAAAGLAAPSASIASVAAAQGGGRPPAPASRRPVSTRPASATRRCSRRSTCRPATCIAAARACPGPSTGSSAPTTISRHARHRGQVAQRRADASLHQQLARHAPLHLVPGRAERVQGRLAQLVRLPGRLALRRAQLRGRRRHRPLQSGRRGGKKTAAEDARRRHGDEGRSRRRRSRRGRRRRSTSRGTSTFPSTAPTAWGATARSTSSRSGIRASASTTTCAAGTPSRISARASSISSTATINSRVTVPAGYIVAATGDAAESARGAHADADRAPRAGGEVGHADPHRHRRRARRAAPRVPRRTGTLTWKFQAQERARRRVGRARPNICGTRRAGRGTWRYALLPPERHRYRGRTRRTCRACRSWSTRSAGSSIRTRRSPPSKARSAAWNTRCSPWKTRAPTSTSCTTSSRTRSATCGFR